MKRVVYGVYVCALICALLVCVIYLCVVCIFSKTQGYALLQKLGFYRPTVRGKPVWIHGVSAGEVFSVEPLLPYLLDCHVFITTSTRNGMAAATHLQTITSQPITVHYFPFDYPWVCRKLLRTVAPRTIIMMECEIWPHFIHEAAKLNIPCYLVNCYFSLGAFRMYCWCREFFKEVLSNYSHFYVQSEEMLLRLAHLGVERTRMTVCRNVKREVVAVKMPKYSQRILIAGSTHSGEEALIIESYRQLLLYYPDLRIVIAPRHPQRSKKLMRQYRPQGALFTQLSDTKCFAPKTLVFLDCFGILRILYARAEIVLVGGSFVEGIGGHNILEPLLLGKPTITGPYTETSSHLIQELRDFPCFMQLHSPLCSGITEALHNWLDTPPQVDTLMQYFHTQETYIPRIMKEILSFSHTTRHL